MRFFDDDHIPLTLDAVTFKAEDTDEGGHTVAKLSLRVEPLTPALAEALDPELRAELFAEDTPRPKISALAWRVATSPQHLDCVLTDDADGTGVGAYRFADVELSEPQVKRTKDADTFALTVTATVGPLGREDLEYLVLRWLRQQRLVTFWDAQMPLPLEGVTAPIGRGRGRPASLRRAQA